MLLELSIYLWKANDDIAFSTFTASKQYWTGPPEIEM